MAGRETESGGESAGSAGAPVGDRWFHHTRNPNSSTALDRQASTLGRAHREPVEKRVPYLVELARGRRVLDVGCVDHDAASAGRASWLHREIAAVAATCVGVDILVDDVVALRAEGYDVRVCDITAGVLDERFDVVLAGEVIEHLAAPQALFENGREMLAPGGRLVITTPNPFALHRVWRGARGDARDNVDHVAYFAPANIAEMAARAGLVLDSWRGVRLKTMHSMRGRAQAGMRRMLTATVFAPEIACETLIYECVDPSSSPKGETVVIRAVAPGPRSSPTSPGR